MPVMDGYEATQRIRKYESEQGLTPTPVVALSANVYDTERNRAMESGMDGFLTKPLLMDVLAEELNNYRPQT